MHSNVNYTLFYFIVDTYFRDKRFLSIKEIHGLPCIGQTVAHRELEATETTYPFPLFTFLLSELIRPMRARWSEISSFERNQCHR